MTDVPCIFSVRYHLLYPPNACTVIRDLQHLQSATLHCHSYLESDIHLTIIRKCLMMTNEQGTVGGIGQI
jgi:hypothetical protein